MFNLDEDAYQALKDYLDAIALRFQGMEESDEIITDIEMRIAEIFQSRVGDKKQVIILDDVREVINILGKPEDFADAGTAAEEAGPDQQTCGKRTKRLYRDPDNTVLGGVAGGIAAYIGTEAWVVRLIFFLLLLGYGVVGIIYIILWIVVPRAVTAYQKLEMRGERVTVSNIEKSVRDSREFKRTTSVAEEILRVFGKIILIILKVALFMIGIGLIIGGITALVAALGIAFVRAPVFPFEIFGIHVYSLKELLSLSIGTGSAVLMSIALILTLAIPVIALIYAGIKMIFRIRSDDRVIGLMALVIWLLSLVAFVSAALFEGRNFTAYGETSFTSTLMEVIVFVPGDHSIHLDRNTRFFLENVSNVSMEPDYNMAGKSWEMTPEGLRLEE